MKTRVSIDPDLLERAVRVGGESSAEATVEIALREFIALREQGRIADLFGKLDWDRSFDPKAERCRRKPPA